MNGTMINLRPVIAAIVLLLVSWQVTAQDLARWKYVKSIRFNTSATGANVTGDVQRYPVAITLDAAGFDFAQAKKDGSDLRFSASETSGLLPFSIEHWDAVNRSALVWVLVETVKGSSTSQSIFMHWGNAKAAAAGNSTHVFNTNHGFTGVWHLEGNDAPTGFKDATANQANGVGVNIPAGTASAVAARTGKGVRLIHAQNQWIKIDEKRKLFDITNQLTFSIWAKADSYSKGYETMFAKGDNSWRLQKFGIKSWHNPPAELVEICVEDLKNNDLCNVGTADVMTGQWFHFVGIHDHPYVKLYVNGVLSAVSKFDTEWKSDDHPVGIGNQSQFPGGGRSWDGILDEARVMNVVKDEHWAKLEYESQREGQRFLSFGTTRKKF